MKKIFLVLLFLPLLLTVGCNKENLPTASQVHVKFYNQTGEDIVGLYANQVEIGDLSKGKSTAEYFGFESLGEQYGFALIESSCDINGKRHYSSSACQGVCGTPSAPDGVWLEKGYYKIAIHLAKPGNYIEFRLEK